MNLRLGNSTDTNNLQHVVLVGDNNNLVYSAKSIRELAEKIQKDQGEKTIRLLRKDEEFINVSSNPESTKNVQSPNGQLSICVTASDTVDLQEFYKLMKS